MERREVRDPRITAARASREKAEKELEKELAAFEQAMRQAAATSQVRGAWSGRAGEGWE
jgi:hypothetical protein